MFRSIHIEGFRGITNLTIDNLDQVNIITGKNNAGKTAVLEAIFLLCAGVNPGLALVINAMRGLERIILEPETGSELPWDSLFLNYDTSSQIKISGVDSKGKTREVFIKVEQPKSAIIDPFAAKTVPEVLVTDCNDSDAKRQRVELSLEKGGPKIDSVIPPLTRAIFVGARRGSGSSDDATRYGRLEIEKREGILVEALKVIEPRLSRVAVVARGGEAILYGDVGSGRLLPLPIMGEGMSRLATIIITLASTRDGVVLIDEVENGFHHTVLKAVWEVISQVARQLSVQVFATTHSLECVASAQKVFIDSTPYDLRVHRIDRSDGVYKIASYDQETIEAALSEGLEIR